MQTYLDFDLLKNELYSKNGCCYYNNNRTELITKCPECETKSIKKHGHLYISVAEPKMNCFRCSFKGSVIKLLRKYKIEPTKYISPVEYEKIKNFKYVEKQENYEIYQYNIDEKTDLDKEKIDYLNKRIGYDINTQNIPNIIFDIDKFVEENNFNHIKEKYKSDWKQIKTDYIWFLTNRGTQLVGRSVKEDSESNKRHYKIYLHNKPMYKDFYGFKSKPFSYDENNYLIMSEGIFDILCSFKNKNLAKIKEKANLWVCCLSRYYDNTILSVLDFYKLPSIHVIILSDRDELPNEYKKLKYKPEVLSYNIFYNKTGKDFGQANIEAFKIK